MSFPSPLETEEEKEKRTGNEAAKRGEHKERQFVEKELNSRGPVSDDVDWLGRPEQKRKKNQNASTHPKEHAIQKSCPSSEKEEVFTRL